MPRHRVQMEHRTFARGQREAMTRAEELIWQAVRAGRLDGWKFKRQVPIEPFVAAFSCRAARLIVEVDGPWHDGADAAAYDGRRDAWFGSLGFRVLRLPTDLVIGSLELAVRRIEEALRHSPSPDPR